jgi:hypothetical protein
MKESQAKVAGTPQRDLLRKRLELMR